MTMIIKTILSVLLCAFCCQRCAAPAPETPLRTQITFSVMNADSVGITLMRDYSLEIGSKYWRQLHVPGNQSLTIDSVTQPMKIAQFQIYKGGEYIMLGEYIGHGGDSIQLEVHWNDRERRVSFSGRGSLKYQCRNMIEAAHEKYFQVPRMKTSAELGQSFFEARNLSRIERDHSQGLDAMMDVLEAFKSDVAELDYRVMEADIRARVDEINLLTLMTFLQGTTSEEERQAIIAYYRKMRWNDAGYGDDVFALSYRFVRRILLKTQVDLFFSRHGKPYTLNDIYQDVKTRYSGMLRERLLANLLVNPIARVNFMLSGEDGYDELIVDALDIVKHPILREPVEKAQRTASGNPVYSFSFTDVYGAEVTPRDFAGKVFLVDLWFTGCSSCISFAEDFKKEVYPFLKNEPQFEVLSVCMDEKAERWQKSLTGGRYSHSGYINVYTNGLGGKDPMIVYYNIPGAPYLLLVDKHGNLFGKPSAAMAKKELLALIQRALATEM